MKERFEVLDIFRGIFSSMVVFFHLSTFSDTPVLNNPLVLNSDLFVDFFFVLSGFVIAYSYPHISNGQEFGRFYRKRFFRLYPLHVIMLFAFLFIELSKQFLSTYVHVNELNNPDNNAFTFISSLLLLNSVKLPGVHDVSWNIPSWSISAEMIAYLAFAMVTVGIHKANSFKNRNIVYGSILLFVIVLFYTATGGFKLTYSFDYGFLRAIMGFFTGILCLNAYNYLKPTLRALPSAIFHALEAIFIALIFTMVWHKQKMESFEIVFELLFFLSILVFAFEKGFISNALKKVGLLHKIGQYSYSIYMTHTLLLSIFNIVFIRLLKFSPQDYVYLFVLNYIIIYLISQWTFKHIEMRFAKKGKKAPK